MTDRIKTALVTGGAKRIGRAIVEDLAANGFAVAIHCNRSADEGAALAREIARAGGKATVIEADLTDMSEVAALIERASAELGPVGLLVNSASIFKDDGPIDLDLAVLGPAFRHPSQGARAACAASWPQACRRAPRGWSSTSSTSACGG